MKIVMLAAANSIHSWRWVEYFAQQGYEIHWVSLVPFTAPALANVRTYDVGAYPKDVVAILRTTRRIKRILHEVIPHLFHVHSAGTYGLVAALTGFHPLLVTAWGSDVLLAPRSLLKRPLVKFVLRRADTITCDAYHMRDAMVRLGAKASKIEVVYFGTDVIKFRPDLDRAEVRRRFKIGDDPVVLSTRRLEPVYDVATFVRALPRVLQAVPKATCVVIGEGSEREKLMAVAEELGVARSVHFVGPVSGDDMPQYLAAADIYVSTSMSDAGLAASTAEAMACGLPVIVTDTAENRLWVEDGTGGFVVPVQRPEVVADKIIYLVRNPDERKRFGVYNRSLIEKHNNYYVEMQKVERVYARVANGFKSISQ